MPKILNEIYKTALASSANYLNFNLYKNGKEYIIGHEEVYSDDYGNGLLDKTIKIVAIPAKYKKLYVTALGHLSFCRTDIESIFIPFSIKILYRSALNTCPHLKDIVFQQSNQLKEFGLYSIGVLESLSEIIFPSSLKVLPNDLFLHKSPSLSKLIYCGSNDFTLTDKVFNLLKI